MTARKWTRRQDLEDGPFVRNGWASRVYRSDDGWTAERFYVPGDRGLVRPATVWEISNRDVERRGAFGGPVQVASLAEAKAFPESEEGQRYLHRDIRW